MFKRVALAVLPFISMAANATIPELPRTDRSIEVDGLLDEMVWEDALRVELEYENDPGENTPAPVRTVAYLAEDGENLFVAFKAYDPQPENIRAWLRDRDSLGPGDFVGISLDTFNDGRRSFNFYANPLGVQFDQTTDDVNNNSDVSWDAIWDSAGRIVDDGYVVEMRIPLNQLRFQDMDGNQTWGFRVVRKYPRDRDVSISNMSKDRGRNCKICQYPKLEGFAGSKQSKNLEIVPTVTASQLRTTEYPGAEPLDTEDAVVDGGVTIRYGLTPEVTANLAINPDFSQIESDGIQLDINNRFSLRYPEKRPFFLEGADYFNMPLQAVFTRSVVDPEAAGKIAGKRGVHTIAAFTARDEVTSLLFPGATGSDATVLEQANTVFVGRYSHSLASTSTLGGVVTARDGDDYRNIVGGVDARWRINDNHEFVAQLLHSQTEYPLDVALEFDQPQDQFSGDALFLRHTFENRDWFAEVLHWQIDDDFRADAGFMAQSGSEQQEVSFGRKWHSDENWWTRMRLRGAYEVKDREDGQLLEDTYIVQFTMNGPLQSWFNVNMRTGQEFDDGQLYDFDRVNVSTRVQPFGGLVLGIHSAFGDEIDYTNSRLANQQRLTPFVSWNVNRHLLLNLNGTRLELDTKGGSRIFDADVVDARLTWQFNMRSYVRLILQQADVERNPDEYVDPVDQHTSDRGRQLLYSWKMNPRTVFFLGYSDAYIDEDNLDSLVASDRSWFMKIGYAWAM